MSERCKLQFNPLTGPMFPSYRNQWFQLTGFYMMGTLAVFFGNEAKGRISKRVLQQKKARQIF